MRRAVWASALAVALAAGLAAALPTSHAAIAVRATDGLGVHVTAQTLTMLTLGWAPQPGEGYEFRLDGQRVSNTWNPATATTRFSIRSGQHVYEVLQLVAGLDGAVTSPAPITTTVVSTTTVTTTPPATTTASAGKLDMNALYQTSPANSVITVPCGSYGPQKITGKGGPITFQAAQSGCVQVADVDFGSAYNSSDGPKNVTVTGFASPKTAAGCTWTLEGQSAGITLNGITACNFYVNGITNSLIENSNFGGCTQPDPSGCGYNAIDSTPLGNNITLTNDVLHDYGTTNDSVYHEQCLFLGGETNVTITGTTFTGCQVFDIFLQYGSSVAAGNFDGLKITGNHFNYPLQGNGQPRDTAVFFSPRGYQFRNVTLTGNTFVPGATLGWDSTTPTPTGFTVTNNTFGVAATCWPGVTYSGNTWPSGSC